MPSRRYQFTESVPAYTRIEPGRPLTLRNADDKEIRSLNQPLWTGRFAKRWLRTPKLRSNLLRIGTAASENLHHHRCAGQAIFVSLAAATECSSDMTLL